MVVYVGNYTSMETINYKDILLPKQMTVVNPWYGNHKCLYGRIFWITCIKIETTKVFKIYTYTFSLKKINMIIIYFEINKKMYIYCSYKLTQKK